MAFYANFTNLTTGTVLTSMSDFTSASVGTEFLKNTGERYTRQSDGSLAKSNQEIYNAAETDGLYVYSAGDTMTGTLNTNSLVPTSTNVYDIGSSSNKYANVYATTFNGTATSANYADLAEKYLADKEYEVGTVVEIGGSKEITEFKGGSLAGVISGEPGVMLNAEAGVGYQYVALKGKVPVKCEGEIKKGMFCIAKEGGIVRGTTKSGAQGSLDIVGIALEDSKSGTVMVKV